MCQRLKLIKQVKIICMVISVNFIMKITEKINYFLNFRIMSSRMLKG